MPKDLFGVHGTISIYSTPEMMKQKVDEYFETCFVMRYDKASDTYIPKEVKPPTYSGLARYLGFSSRSQMLNYKSDDARGFEDVINDAMLRIEDYLEGKLVYSKAPTGIMFSLKNNAGWEDKSKRELSGNGGGNNLVIGWVGDSSDVIDVSANEGATPGGGSLLESTSKEEVVG